MTVDTVSNKLELPNVCFLDKRIAAVLGGAESYIKNERIELMHHPMRRKDREITDRAAMLDIIKAAKYAVIALCRQNEPYIVAMSYGFDETKDTFYFHGADKGQKIDFIKDNPNACLTIIQDDGYEDGECAHAYRSIVCRGQMSLVDGQDERVYAIETMIHQLEPHPETQLPKIHDGDQVWRRTQMFKMEVESMTCKQRRKIV